MTSTTHTFDPDTITRAIEDADVDAFVEHLDALDDLRALTLEHDGQPWPILHRVLSLPFPPEALDARHSMALYLATHDVDMHRLGPDHLTALSHTALALRRQPEWSDRIEILRFLGKLIDIWPSSHPEDHLETDHDSLLSHARWEDDHGDPDILGPATRSIAQNIRDALDYTPPVEGELRGTHDLDGSTLTFTDFPLNVTDGHHVHVSNGTLEYDGYELGTIVVDGPGASLTLTDVNLGDISVSAVNGATLTLERCTVTGRYGSVYTRHKGSRCDIRDSTFNVACAGANDHATLTITDTSFDRATRSAVNANTHAIVKMTRGSISNAPVSEHGATAYKGGTLTLEHVRMVNCWTFLRALGEESQILARHCAILKEMRSSKLVARARDGGSITLSHTEIHPDIEDLVDSDDSSNVTFLDCTREP